MHKKLATNNVAFNRKKNQYYSNTTTFNILDYLDRIKIVKETSSDYHCKCPKCGDGGFKIDKATGKYNAFKCNCEINDIRECIRPWEEVQKSRPWEEIQNSHNREQKSIRPKNYREWVYHDRQGNLLVKTCRRDDGRGQKKQWQKHRTGENWENGYGDKKIEDIPIYRYPEVREAIWRGETIFIVEGEPCADILWQRGLAATTNIGGAKKWLPSHTKDLSGANLVVLTPDRDRPGIERIEQLSKEFPNAKYLYPNPKSSFWNRELPADKGFDIFDWLTENKVTKEDILNAIEDRPRNLKLPKDHRKNNNILQHPASTTKPEEEVSIPLDEVLLKEIDSLVTENLSSANLEAKIIALASNFSRATRDIWKLYSSRAGEIEKAENRDATKEEVNRLLKIQDYKLELKKYLQAPLAEPLERLAVYLGVNNATLLTTLLTASASLLPIDTKLELIKATKFYAHPILYAGICAPSGSGKSPAKKAILEPLFKLQQAEDRRYALAEAEYKRQLKEFKRTKNSDLEEPEPPLPPREYFTTDSTSEAIANIQNNQPNNGFLGYFDELKQLIGQSNSYRSSLRTRIGLSMGKRYLQQFRRREKVCAAWTAAPR